MRAVTLAQFAGIMERSIILEAEAAILARGVVAAEIASRARARIGDPEKLPPELAESTQEERVRKGYSADEPLLRTGELRDSISWEHRSPISTVVGSTSEIAVYQELGTVRIPPRPFLGSTITEDEKELAAIHFAAWAARFRQLR